MIADEWFAHARPEQYPLAAPRDTWLVIGGRGSGKTRLGAEWINALARGFAPFARARHGRLALVGETLADVREVMIEGPSGILAVSRRHRPRYEASRRRLVWETGAVAQVFSSEDPDSLRGPQFEAAWCDELAKWRRPQETFDMLQFGLRLGPRPRQIVTTTPRPIPLLRRLIDDEQVTVTRMRSRDNAANLAPGFLAAVERRYAGTRLARQELDGELIADRADALWTRALIEAAAGPPGPLGRVVVGLDPPAGGRGRGALCGLVVAGLEADGTRAVVLADGTLEAAQPRAWAERAVALYHRHAADAIVAEVNQGGQMVSAVLATVDPTVAVRPVRAQRGKWLRAEPVAALYQQGRVRHAERFAALEDEMCDFGPDGLSQGRSPDRVDALVWAITELMLAGRGEPRIRDFV
ncbi:terminase family protein [Aquibium sp. A9E412]|uniref:DNA-packaging protein n=1 Tax=Aquibium sp. A9E412 TaxID=2976767 RepID=UPI0025B22807|nr:terminase family protein [Aquibium sp. A9E412]MDN2567983.1 terminase family protein [Aquibium sp. A9E412]